MKKLLKLILWLAIFALVFQAGFYVGRTWDEVDVSAEVAAPASSTTTTAETTPAVDLSGVWSPIEAAKGTLTFQYGVCTHHAPALGGGYVDREYPYSIKGNHLYLKNQYLGVHPTATIDCEFRITDEGHLVINNVTGFAGKYKRAK